VAYDGGQPGPSCFEVGEEAVRDFFPGYPQLQRPIYWDSVGAELESPHAQEENLGDGEDGDGAVDQWLELIVGGPLPRG